jgi:hypothetical protein
MRLWFPLNRLISVAPYAAGIDTTRACLRQLVVLERAITSYSQSLTGQTRLVLVVSEICAGGTILDGLEKDAREAKKGLWADP